MPGAQCWPTCPPTTGGDIYTQLRMTVGACPAGCGTIIPEGTIYRSSRRSITMRCPQCGLKWTMTVHQIATAAKRWSQGIANEQAAASLDRFAALMAEWANTVVDDRRGRRSGAG